MSPSNFFFSCQNIDLKFVYPNLLFNVFYDNYWDCYKHIAGHYRSYRLILAILTEPWAYILSFRVFRVITLPMRCINNVITVTVIIVILCNTITASNSSSVLIS